MDNKKVNVCSCVALGGTVASALFHFVFCGLPALIGFAGFVFGFYGVLDFDFITPRIREFFLIMSGIFIMISFLFYLKERCCINNNRAFKIKKYILFVSIGLYMAGVVFHFLSSNMLSEPVCH